MSGPVVLAPGSGDLRHTNFDLSGAGDKTIVSAVAGRAIVVLSYVLDVQSGGSNTLTWKRAATAISGAMDVGPGPVPALVAPWNPWGHFKTNKGEALILNLALAPQVGGCLSYMLIDRGP